MLLSRQAEVLHQDIAPPVWAGATLEVVGLAQALHRERERNLELAKKPPQVLQGLIKWQRKREPLAAQNRVRGIHHELRARHQVFGGGSVGVVARERLERKRLHRVGDEI